MKHYRITYTRADGSHGALSVIAANRWDAYTAIFNALERTAASGVCLRAA